MTENGDAGLRRTPYELVFGPERFEAEVFPAIAEEAGSRGQLGAGPESFVMLGTVGRLLRELRPAGGVGAGSESAPPPQAVAQYGALVWHAWSFWRAGHPVFALSSGLARRLLADTESVGPWTLCAPDVAGYVQLPRHLLWARVDEHGPAEPVDGLHWTWLEEDASGGRARPRLDVLLALGMRPGRGGLSVIEVSASAADAAGHWGDAEARGDGRDFDNILPGGELQGYHGIVAVAEVLKLVSRIFHWIDRRPDSIERVLGFSGGDGADAEAPRSRFPFAWVRDPGSGTA